MYNAGRRELTEMILELIHGERDGDENRPAKIVEDCLVGERVDFGMVAIIKFRAVSYLVD